VVTTGPTASPSLPPSLPPPRTTPYCDVKWDAHKQIDDVASAAWQLMMEPTWLYSCQGTPRWASTVDRSRTTRGGEPLLLASRAASNAALARRATEGLRFGPVRRGSSWVAQRKGGGAGQVAGCVSRLHGSILETAAACGGVWWCAKCVGRLHGSILETAAACGGVWWCAKCVGRLHGNGPWQTGDSCCACQGAKRWGVFRCKKRCAGGGGRGRGANDGWCGALQTNSGTIPGVAIQVHIRLGLVCMVHVLGGGWGERKA
jgi:hypothetical protein